MKYIISLLAGIIAGVLLFVIGLAYNPFVNSSTLSPLATTDARTLTYTFSAVPTDSVVFTNDGESRTPTYPEKVQQLWEAPISQTTAMATVLNDSRNQAAGFGIKFSSVSEQTRLFEGKALVDSVWFVYLPGRGTLFIEQTENYWAYLRDIVLPAYRSSSGTWKGIWTGVITAGPGELSMARVIGGSGEFEGMTMHGVESLSVRTWRDTSGLLAAEGQLTIELPENYAGNRQ